MEFQFYPQFPLPSPALALGIVAASLAIAAAIVVVFDAQPRSTVGRVLRKSALIITAAVLVHGSFEAGKLAIDIILTLGSMRAISEDFSTPTPQ